MPTTGQTNLDGIMTQDIENDLRPEDLTILYEDEHLLAIDKPTGLLVHEGWGKADVVLVDLMRDIVRGDQVFTLNRLDRPTSGVILFAQHADAARAFRALFEEHRIDKGYLALVRGQCPDQGWLDYPIPKQRKSPKRVEAISAFRQLWFGANTEPREVSLVHVAPQTGRSHQIRRHLRHLNHPLIGDTNYGRSNLNHAFRDNYNLTRLALHAHSVHFIHPMTEQPTTIYAPLANDLCQSFSAMGMPASVYDTLHEQSLASWVNPLREDKDNWITD